MKVILLGNGTKQGVQQAIDKLRPELERRVNIVAEDFTGRADVSQIQTDLVIVFGGDGSILRAASQMGLNQAPVLAVHLGTLSFLSTIQAEELIPLLDDLDVLNLPIIRHLLLRCELFRAEKDRNSDPDLSLLALNEVVLHGDHTSQMVGIELHIDHDFVTIYRGDGLILSTPVGSTARNLAAGGPIIRKDVDAVVISPISPHTLSNRPLVDSPDRLFELRVHQPASLVLDGAEAARIVPGDIVFVRRAEETFKTIGVPGFCYYKALRTKLGWNGSFTG